MWDVGYAMCDGRWAIWGFGDLEMWRWGDGVMGEWAMDDGRCVMGIVR